MAKQEVLVFLENHNRPFSIKEIQEGIKGDFGKAAVQKALDNLVENEKVKEKVYGKQKVYCILQQNDASTVEIRESILEVDRQINETTWQLKEVSSKLKANSAKMVELQGKISLEDALNQKMELEKELEDIKHKLEKYSEIEPVCPKAKIAADKEYEKNMNEYKKRKRICMDVLNSILENYPKTKKHLYEEIGVETDEDVGFSIDTVYEL